MIYLGDCYFWIGHARSYLRTASILRLHSTGDEFEINNAAFNVAMAAESALKYLLCHAGSDYSATHSHRLLATQCGQAGIKIPMEVRALLQDIQEYESKTRYVQGYVVSPVSLDRTYKVIHTWVSRLFDDFVEEAYAELACTVPPALLSSYEDKVQFVIDNVKLLRNSS